MKKGISLQELLSGIDLPLTEEQIFLVQSFLLAEIKTQLPPKDPLCFTIVSEPKKLKKFGNVSSSFLENLISKTRKSLATASVAFVQNQAKILKNDRWCQITTEYASLHKQWLPCIPMFWTYQILLTSAQKQEIPIVFYAKVLDKDYRVVEERSLYFKPLSGYEEVVPYESDLSKPAIFIEGVVGTATAPAEWKKRMRALDVILAGAADHRQYPDEKDDTRIETLNDPEFQRYRQIAKQEGFSLQNPGTFFIQHVYPSTARTLTSLCQRMRFIEERLTAFYPQRRLVDWPQRAVTQILFYLEM